MPDTPINVDYPSSDDLRLRIALGACRFRADPGEGEAWITGICHDPTDKRAPRIVEDEGTVRITESEPSFERIPAVFGGVPRYELAIGKGRPFALTVETGASEFEMELGGVPVSSLMVRQEWASSNSVSPLPTPIRWSCSRSRAGLRASS